VFIMDLAGAVLLTKIFQINGILVQTRAIGGADDRK